jgi:acyl carrier protein
MVAYAVTPSGLQWTEAELFAFLRERLPGYMVPQRFVHVDRFPLTSNGKLDREALLTLAQEKIECNDTYKAPQTWVEERLVLIWQQVLKRQQIGVDENFFALGGHSLLAIQVIARVRDIFQVELLMRTIFECSTIVDLARHIEQMRYSIIEHAENKELAQMLVEMDNHLKEGK